MEQALMVKPSAALTVPDYLKGEVGNVGSEAVTKDDLLIPRLGQAQALSPQVDKRKDGYIEDLEIGGLFNTATGEVYGESVTVIPLDFFSQFIELKPLEDGGGIVKRYDKVQDVPPQDLEYTDDGKGGSNRPKVTHFRNRLCFIWDGTATGLEPIVVSFKNSGRKACNSWNMQILKRGVNSYCQVYELKSTHRQGGGFEWEGLAVNFKGFTPEELLKVVKVRYAELRAQPIQVNYEGADAEETSAAKDADISF